MNIQTVYRMLLCLYPYSFRKQFAEEMREIFRRLIQNHVATRWLMFASFVLREFIGLLIGAVGAWIVIIMPKREHIVIPVPYISEYFPRPTAEEAALSTPELQQRLDATRASMFEAAARHDLVIARSYEAESARLQLFLNRRNRPRKS